MLDIHPYFTLAVDVIETGLASALTYSIFILGLRTAYSFSMGLIRGYFNRSKLL